MSLGSGVTPAAWLTPRCTCQNQSTYYGSSTCSEDSTCRKEKDKAWWAKINKEEENK